MKTVGCIRAAMHHCKGNFQDKSYLATPDGLRANNRLPLQVCSLGIEGMEIRFGIQVLGTITAGAVIQVEGSAE